MKKYINLSILSLLFFALISVNNFAYAQQEEVETSEEIEEATEEVEEIIEEVETNQEDDSYEVESILKHWQEKYVLTVTENTFSEVYEAVVKAIEAQTCPVIRATERTNDEGFAKGVIISDFCIIAVGDSTYEYAKQFSVLATTETRDHSCLPYIPGGRWKNARIKYKFIIKETEDDEVIVTLRGCEISGKEAYVTRKYFFWESNGILENNIINHIQESLK